MRLTDTTTKRQRFRLACWVYKDRKCDDCGQPLESGGNWELHHKTTESYDSDYDNACFSDFEILCRDCHSRRHAHDATLEEHCTELNSLMNSRAPRGERFNQLPNGRYCVHIKSIIPHRKAGADSVTGIVLLGQATDESGKTHEISNPIDLTRENCVKLVRVMIDLCGVSGEQDDSWVQKLSACVGKTIGVNVAESGRSVRFYKTEGNVTPTAESKDYSPSCVKRKSMNCEPLLFYNPGEVSKAQQLLIAMMAEKMLPKGMVQKTDFDDSLYAEIFEYLNAGADPCEFIECLPEDKMKRALEALDYTPLPETKKKAFDLATELLDTISKERRNSRITALTERLKTASPEEREDLTRQLTALLKL